MRFIFSIITTCAVCYGAYFFYQNNPDVVESSLHFFQKKLPSKEFQTLEIRYTSEQIMAANRRALIKDKRHTFLEPSLKFYPYVLLEVKYSTKGSKTAEGMMLWGLVDGEMILDMAKWTKTHGYEDCLIARATKAEFVVLNLLAKNGGAMERTRLLNALRSSKQLATDTTLLSCQRKKLIVQEGTEVRLHFADPCLTQHPLTHVDQWLVTKPYRDATCVAKKYSISQIKDLANAAFGHDFAIRRAVEVFLPVYEIEVKNPDGTLMTTHWNAVTGTQITSAYVPPQAGSVLNITDIFSHNDK